MARRILIVLGGAILFFFVHHALHVSPSLVALSAAALGFGKSVAATEVGRQ